MDGLRAILLKPTFKDAVAMAAWNKLEASAVDEALVIHAIEKMAPSNSHKILDGSGVGFTDAVVGAILKKKGAWDDELRPQVAEISTCPDDDPMARLRSLVKATGNLSPTRWGYKPELSAPDKGTVLALGKAAPFTVSEKVWPGFGKGYPGLRTPTFAWSIKLDKAVFGPAPEAPDAGEASGSTASFTLSPKKAGATRVTVEVSIFQKSGFIAKVSKDYAVAVAGGFTVPQQAIVDAILAGTNDDESDIANLVALGQKLSVIDINQGNPTHPTGMLATKMSDGTWKQPTATWLRDASLKRKDP